MEAILEAVEKGRSALIEGSNGLGKTIAVLSACLPKAEESDLKILYVARTHRQHDRVIEELKAISKKLRVSGISIRGRHEMCPNSFVTRYASDARSVMEACEMLKARDRCQYYRSIEERAEEYSARYGSGLERVPKKPFFNERRGMSPRENERMVADFKTYANRGGAVLLGVQGRRSSEGVDYPGDEINSVVIVGVPYAKPTPKVKAQIGYFDKKLSRARAGIRLRDSGDEEGLSSCWATD
jgi:Rad3-related DNA helicase